MARGLWNKIKRGFKKVGSIFKKGLGKVNDKFIKPFKPIMKAVANAVIPCAGIIVDAASDGIDAVTKNDWGSAAKSGKDIASWANNRFGK